MADALDIIAEARRRQEAAERDRDYYKSVAKNARKRCRGLIDMMKLRPIEPPSMTDEGEAHWHELEKTVEQFAEVMADPYAQFPDDNDPDGYSLTHERVKEMMVYRLAVMIKRAVDKSRKPAD